MRTHRFLTFSAFAVASGGIAACGGSGTSGPPPVSTATPLLVAGTVTNYTGTDTIAHVYQNPTAGQSNYTETYSFVGVSTLKASASGAAAPFDLNSITTFTTLQAPPAGTQKQKSTVDDYESQTASGATLTLAMAASKTVAVGTDITAGASGAGPYAITTTTSTTDTTPFTTGIYPLVTGAVYQEPFAKTTTTSTTDINAAGQGPATAYVTLGSQTIANDGSYTRTDQFSNGEQLTFVESSNGSAQAQESGPLFTLAETIGVPVAGNAGDTIPVSQTNQPATLGPTPAPTATARAFEAVDWYPGAALPPQPLSNETVTVKGPVTTLPAACNGALSEPDVVELDLALTTLNVSGFYQTETQQRFTHNALNVCILRTTTTQNYSITTGLPTNSTTETYTQILTSVTPGSSSAAVHRATAVAS
jgi:hypothetical protein